MSLSEHDSCEDACHKLQAIICGNNLEETIHWILLFAEALVQARKITPELVEHIWNVVELGQVLRVVLLVKHRQPLACTKKKNQPSSWKFSHDDSMRVKWW